MQQDDLDAVLEGRAWQHDVEAIAESTGAVVAVLSADRSAVEMRCPVCLLTPSSSAPSLDCFATHLASSSPVLRLLPRRHGLRPAARHRSRGRRLRLRLRHLEAARRALRGRLLETGLSEREARAVARATPILRRDAALALARLAASHVEALVASGAEDDRGLEYELLYDSSARSMARSTTTTDCRRSWSTKPRV